MTDGNGWDMDATAIIKGTKNLDAAKRLADWAATCLERYKLASASLMQFCLPEALNNPENGRGPDDGNQSVHA